MHSPEIGHGDRIPQRIRLEPAVSLVSFDPRRSRAAAQTFHVQLSVGSKSSVRIPSHLTSSTARGGCRVRGHRPPARNAFEPCQIAFRVAMDRSLSLRSDLASSIRSAVRSTSAGADRIVGASMMGKISEFIHHHYRHFNAAALIEAADAYRRHLDQGGQMLVTLAGAMSTAELGLSLAEMIREGKVHAISCTGANLEEDIFNLVAHECTTSACRFALDGQSRKRLPHYRELSAKDEEKLMVRHLYRVTDTCIPEDEAVRPLEKALLDEWRRAENERRTPISRTNSSTGSCLPARSRITTTSDKGQLGASRRAERPADLCSRLGGLHARQHFRELRHQQRRRVKRLVHTVRTGIEYMVELANWYQATCRKHSIGFFQIGGGIAGDFPICVVPMLEQNLKIAMFRAGVISARSATRPRATGRTRVLFQTRRSHGASSRQRHRSSLSSQTPPSWHRSFSPMSWANSWWACPCWLTAGKIAS